MQKLCCVRTRQQFSASLVYLVTSLPPYLHQFSTISGGNCINQAHEEQQQQHYNIINKMTRTKEQQQQHQRYEMRTIHQAHQEQQQ